MRTSNSSTSQRLLCVVRERENVAECVSLLCAQSPIYIHLQQKRGLMIRDRKKIFFASTTRTEAA